MSEQTPHEAGQARPGEALDLTRLGPYLSERLGLGQTLRVSQFPAGHSNLTYLIQDERRALVLRRPPRGAQIKSGHDMSREHRMLAAVYPAWPYVPEPLLLCEDASILGAPFYVMERVEGVILRGAKPRGATLEPTQVHALCQTFVQTLAQLHTLDLDACGLRQEGRPQGYVERQVQGWTQRYARARTSHVEALERVASWLADHAPPERGASLIHNDLKYDNMVLAHEDLTRLRAVLDWEMATVGDPWMDLGTALGYWVEADDPPVLQLFQFGPTSLPGSMTRQELVQAYAQARGLDDGVEDALFYFVFGLFKIAGIAQQIYARYQQGLTQDERFASLGYAVEALGQTALRAIDAGRISGLGQG